MTHVIVDIVIIMFIAAVYMCDNYERSTDVPFTLYIDVNVLWALETL